jgi:hypothetical protein
VSKLILSFFISAITVIGQSGVEHEKKLLPLNSTDGLELINVKAEVVEHNGQKGIEISKIEGEINGETLVVIPDVSFKNGTITLELTGEPAANAAPQMRGFVGVAFRINPADYSSYDCFYLRPTNARANNQLQRNHTTQYVAHPEFPWYILRKENPGLYESYIDMAPGEWTKVKIEISGKTVKLYLHGSEQPCLIVNELKHEESMGKIALWLHSSTLARYRNLVVTPK